MASRTFGRAIRAAAMLLASWACAHGAAAVSEGARPSDAQRPVRLEVTNESGAPMKVFAAGPGTYYWIGTVYPGLRERFVVPPGMAVRGAIEFLARSSSGSLVRTGPLQLAPGDVVDFALTPHAATSMARVRLRQAG